MMQTLAANMLNVPKMNNNDIKKISISVILKSLLSPQS